MNINLLNTEQQSLLSQAIGVAEKIVVCTHVSPDGDAIGSSLGWKGYLEQQGKQVTVCVPDQFPDFLVWLPGAKSILRHDKYADAVQKAFDEADLIFCLDFNTPSRLRDMEHVLTECAAPKIMIDHHPSPDIDTILTISYPSLCSTSELVFDLIWQLGGYDTMTKEMAVCIYCGMMTDTGGFVYNSNTPEIYFIISQLLVKGIDKDKIYRKVYWTFSENRLRLQGHVLLKKMHVVREIHAAWFTLSKQDMLRFRYKKGDAEGLVNMPLQINGMRLSISLREDTEKENCIWVSLRSVDDVNCTEIANRFFNGGGHKNASGGHLYCSLEEAEIIVQKALIAFADKIKGS